VIFFFCFLLLRDGRASLHFLWSAPSFPGFFSRFSFDTTDSHSPFSFSPPLSPESPLLLLDLLNSVALRDRVVLLSFHVSFSPMGRLCLTAEHLTFLLDPSAILPPSYRKALRRCKLGTLPWDPHLLPLVRRPPQRSS